MRILTLPVFAAFLLAVAITGCSDSPAAPSAVPSAATPASTPTSIATSTPVADKRLGTASGVRHTIAAPDFEALPGARASFGTIGTAAYRIEVPDGWDGELVLYAHGVRLGSTEVAVSNPLGPMRGLFIEGGFAWAASSYSENGYVPGIGADDTVALLRHFEQQYGKPKRIYLFGESMGGNVVTLLMEAYPNRFDGALAVCGALGGEEQIDFLISWAMAAEYFSGTKLPIGTGGGTAAMTNILLGQVAPALGSPTNPTEAGKRFLSVIRNLTGGPRPFFLEGLSLQYQQNFGLLLVDPERKSVAAAAATNAGAVYDVDEALGVTDDQVNAGIRRLPADPAARDGEAHPEAVPTTGQINRPLLTLHTTGDLFVPITQEISYLAKVKAAGKESLLVQRLIRAPGHCRFSEEEYTTAWNDLVAWVREGKRPAGDDLTASLADAGRAFTDPIRPGDPGTK
jgi:pimeloyl-ACP methyl ester carboxylesterase